MLEDKKIIAIIPARGGSKGLPRKNILPLGGIPLIGWSINAAKESKYIDRLIISSDSDEICSLVRELGCDVPFKRPSELSNDTANSVDVVSHAISVCGDVFDIVILLQPTSPFRSSTDIDKAIELFVSSCTNSVVSVVESDKSPEWMYWLGESKNDLFPIMSGVDRATRRQDTKKAYVLNGALYIIDKEHFLTTQKFVDETTVAYVMDRKSSIDIDTALDLEIANILLEKVI
tara:strand:- start:12631 stop:13326 length:696 start_codon:yes stop_codon:yes gene_type:complete